MSFSRRLQRDAHFRALVLIPSGVLVLSILAAFGVSILLRNSGTPVQRAERLSDMGQYDAADRLYVQAFETGPITMRTLIGYIDNRADLLHVHAAAVFTGDTIAITPPAPADFDLNALLSRSAAPPEMVTLGRYWVAVRSGTRPKNEDEVQTLANRPRPVRWANHLLARAALYDDNEEEAARRFEREGLAYPKRAAIDLEHALGIWIDNDQWDEVRRRLDDPRYQAVIGPSFRLAIAEHDHDWPRMLLWLWPSGYEGVRGWPLLLAAVAALLWLAIAGRMGRADEPVPGRKKLYVTAFFLGVLSIYPTLILISAEEVFLRIQETGQPIADALYFVFGVGLREELCKLLLFLPLLPALNRRGSRIEAMTCGALVGLGFAAEENIGYFHMMDPSAAIGRFLTANFLHMALTSLVAVAAYDMSSARRRPSGSLNTTFIIAIAIHGAYDFFLSTPGLSLLAMILFIILSQRFLRELLFAAPDAQRQGLLRLFVISLAVLLGLSYVYATTLVGLATAVGVVFTGFVGVAIMTFIFVRELDGA